MVCPCFSPYPCQLSANLDHCSGFHTSSAPLGWLHVTEVWTWFSLLVSGSCVPFLFYWLHSWFWGFLSGSVVKNLPAMQETQETWVRSLGQEDPLKEEPASDPSILAWRIPWTEEPGGVQPMGSQRAGHSWAHTQRSWFGPCLGPGPRFCSGSGPWPSLSGLALLRQTSATCAGFPYTPVWAAQRLCYLLCPEITQKRWPQGGKKIWKEHHLHFAEHWIKFQSDEAAKPVKSRPTSRQCSCSLTLVLLSCLPAFSRCERVIFL